MKISFYCIMRLMLIFGWMIGVSVQGNANSDIAKIHPTESNLTKAINACLTYIGGGGNIYNRMIDISKLAGITTANTDLSVRMRSAINTIKPSAASIKGATDNVISDMKPGASSVEQAVTDVKTLIGRQGVLSVQIRSAIDAIQSGPIINPTPSIKVATDNVISDIKPGVSSVQQAVTDVKTLIGRSGTLSNQMRSAINAIKPNAATIKEATDNVISDIKTGFSSVQQAVTDVKTLIGRQGALSVQMSDAIKTIHSTETILTKAIDTCSSYLGGATGQNLFVRMTEVSKLVGNTTSGTDLTVRMSSAIKTIKTDASSVEQAVTDVKALIGGQGALSDQMRIAINAIQPSATSIKVATDNVIKDIKTGVSSVQQAVTDVKTLIGRSGALSVQMSDAINAIKPNAASIKAATDNVISDIKLGVSSVERAVTDVKALIGGQGALSVQIGIPTDSIKDINNDTFPDLTNNIFQPTDSVFAKLNYIYWRLKQRSWTQQPGSVHDALQMILKEITAPNTNPINTGVIDIDTMIGGNSYVPLKTRVITLHETMGGILPANPSVAFESALTKATKAREKTVAIYKKITGLDAVAGSVSIFEMLDAIEQRLGE